MSTDRVCHRTEPNAGSRFRCWRNCCTIWTSRQWVSNCWSLRPITRDECHSSSRPETSSSSVKLFCHLWRSISRLRRPSSWRPTLPDQVLNQIVKYADYDSRLIPGAGAVNAGVATVREKELVANLFCKLADFVRSKLSVIGVDAKISVKCLQVYAKWAKESVNLCWSQSGPNPSDWRQDNSEVHSGHREDLNAYFLQSRGRRSIDVCLQSAKRSLQSHQRHNYEDVVVTQLHSTGFVTRFDISFRPLGCQRLRCGSAVGRHSSGLL